jgi:hypothetical protein
VRGWMEQVINRRKFHPQGVAGSDLSKLLLLRLVGGFDRLPEVRWKGRVVGYTDRDVLLVGGLQGPDAP